MKIHMNMNLVNAQASTAPTRIRFPYDWENTTEDEKWEILHTVFESGIALEDIKSVKVFALLMPGKWKIRGGYQIDITGTKGKAYSKRIVAEVDPEEACTVLKPFFTAKAPGLDAEYRLCLNQLFDDYRRVGDSQRCTIALNILESGGTVDDVITALLPYQGKARVFY